MDRIVSSSRNFAEDIKSIIQASGNGKDEIAQRIAQLKASASAEDFYKSINSALLSVVVYASSFRASGIVEYYRTSKNILHAIDELFSKSKKDTSVIETIDIGLRYYQSNEVKDMLKSCRAYATSAIRK